MKQRSQLEADEVRRKVLSILFIIMGAALPLQLWAFWSRWHFPHLTLDWALFLLMQAKLFIICSPLALATGILMLKKKPIAKYPGTFLAASFLLDPFITYSPAAKLSLTYAFAPFQLIIISISLFFAIWLVYFLFSGYQRLCTNA